VRRISRAQPVVNRAVEQHVRAAQRGREAGCELGIVERAGNRLPAGQAGEVIVRSRAVMAGY
jgi:long-subunit acyl-CoA synthetase (AMP-forming)